MTQEKILIIDDDDSIRWVLEKATAREGIDSLCRASAENIEEILTDYRPHAIISDIRMPGLDGMELLAEVQKLHPELPVIIMTAHSDLETAVAAFKGGAFEYLPKPFDIEEALRDPVTGETLVSKSAVSDLTDQLWEDYVAFCQRDLSGFQVEYVFMDGLYEGMRLHKSRKEAILVAWGVCRDGRKVLLHLALGNK